MFASAKKLEDARLAALNGTNATEALVVTTASPSTEGEVVSTHN